MIQAVNTQETSPAEPFKSAMTVSFSNDATGARPRTLAQRNYRTVQAWKSRCGSAPVGRR